MLSEAKAVILIRQGRESRLQKDGVVDIIDIILVESHRGRLKPHREQDGRQHRALLYNPSDRKMVTYT